MKRNWKCLFGFHDWKQPEQLITMSSYQCSRRNSKLIRSLYGDFVYPPETEEAA